MLKYLSRYAEPICSRPIPEQKFRNVVVLPCFDESPREVRAVIDSAPSANTLWIVVVNAARDREPAAIERTRYLLAQLKANAKELHSDLFLEELPNRSAVAIVDRVSESELLPAKEGVGLARKLGGDLALSWSQQGAISSPWLHFSDADVRFPKDYFSCLTDIPKTVRGLAYPFTHQCEHSTLAGRALEFYEMSLRYFRLGLSWAQSPYAYHSIGSTMAVRFSSYAQVRGVPKRLAGEDFYLLNKVRKLGSIAVPKCNPLKILQRPSTRTPFGTGVACAEIEEQLRRGNAFTVYNPRSFALLRNFVELLEEFSQKGDTEILETLPTALREALPIDTEARLLQDFQSATTPALRMRRFHTWFDALRTLRLIHALRDGGLVDVPWEDAVDSAPFVPDAAPSALRDALAARDKEISPSLW